MATIAELRQAKRAEKLRAAEKKSYVQRLSGVTGNRLDMPEAIMTKKQSKKYMKELSKMPQEAPVTQGPDEFGPRTHLRERILAMSLFPNVYNRHMLKSSS